jgi:D-cysteine desulfhydrase
MNFGSAMARSGYFLPPGGSNMHGTLGFVDAAFEIKRQVEEKDIPEPKRIYVAAGSGGTMAGLMVGAKLAGLSSEIIGVRVAEKWLVNQITVSALANRAARFLRETDSSVPEVNFRREDVVLNHDYMGKGYGFFTPEGRRAVKLMEKKESIHLEGTYTGKAFVAVLDAIRQDPKMPTLFINTCNSVDIYSSLPQHCNLEPIPDPMRDMVLED